MRRLRSTKDRFHNPQSSRENQQPTMRNLLVQFDCCQLQKKRIFITIASLTVAKERSFILFPTTMKQKTMAIPTSPTTKKHGKTMLFHAPPPPPPITYPPNSPTHHVVTRHPGGSYSSPRAHRGVLGMPVSPYAHRSVPVSPVAGTRLGTAVGASLVEGPPEPSQQRKAMEAAVAAERTRSTQCEKEEIDMTAEELRAILKKERRRTAKIAADLASFKCSAVQQQLESEVFEEGRINELMRRVDFLQHEKEKIIVALEREEEMVSDD